MKARCKFTVSSVTTYGGGRADVKLEARYDEPLSKEDIAFSSATPCGAMTATITNPAVIEMLQPGREFYVDLIPVDGEG